MHKRNETPVASGQYQEIGPRGGKGREVTTARSEKVPPSTKPGITYSLVGHSERGT